ncbi:MAG: tyrosine-type recombinase/integrase [Oscillospiraceae bacterium]|nr:tyrosine-type recombinase/integrase [Oscillospiraceae bacterium]
MSICKTTLERFSDCLRAEDRSKGTIDKYRRDAERFAAWLGERAVSRELASAWRDALLEQGCAPATVNSMVSAVNRLLKFLGREDCLIRFLRVQRRAFREQGRELTREEYRRLLETARDRGRQRLALLMETICATGIRVSEVRFITVEAARRGRAEISLKGKIRTILLPAKLCRKLLKYAGAEKAASGEIFRTKSGKSISRRQIWREMKDLCALAGVEASKVFPHNLRHLFATVFYRACRDIVKLADVLGHSSINTTRLYLLTTGAEHARHLERLGLVT